MSQQTFNPSSLCCENIVDEYSGNFKSAFQNDCIKKLEKSDFNSKKIFSIWITQEYLFIQELIKLFGKCLSKSPDTSGLKVLSRGIIFFRDNLVNLESRIIEQKIKHTDIAMLNETKDYINFIKSLYNQDYSAQITYLWLICYMYNRALEENQFESIFTDIISPCKGFEFAEVLERLKEESNKNLSENNIKIDSLRNNIDKITELETNTWKMLSKTS